jgi:AcrR family transcriptional regulator
VSADEAIRAENGAGRSDVGDRTGSIDPGSASGTPGGLAEPASSDAADRAGPESISGDPTSGAVAQTGRALGPRALKTRERLLDATESLLNERSLLDIAVVDIARLADTSPATFYHYFKDVEEAALLLAERAAEETPGLLQLIAGDWHGQAGVETSRALAQRFIGHWEAHHAVLTVRNLAADRGDPRFQVVRRKALSPVLDALAVKLATENPNMSGMHPFAAAAAMVGMLEKLSAHVVYLIDARGVERDELINTTASILQLVVTGGQPA